MDTKSPETPRKETPTEVKVAAPRVELPPLAKIELQKTAEVLADARDARAALLKQMMEAGTLPKNSATPLERGPTQIG